MRRLCVDAQGFEDAAVARVAHTVDGADVAVLRASFDLIRTSTRLVQHLERCVHRPAGWSMAGFRVMFCIWVGGDMEPREIAHFSGLSRAAVSSALNTLERDGLVQRTRESEDRRLVTARLTPAGEHRLVQAYESQNEAEQEFFEPLSAAELRRFTHALQSLLSPDGDRPPTKGSDVPA